VTVFAVAANQIAFAKAPHLVVNHAEDAVGMPRPIVLWMGLFTLLAASVADQSGEVRLPGCLQSEVIVDASIRQDYVRGKGRAMKVAARMILTFSILQFEVNR